MRRADRLFVDKGRGAVTNPAGRFESTSLEPADDGWGSLDALPVSPATQLIAEFPRHAITTNRSPDVPFDQSLNPYQGCEHGCIYCFARPAHAYLNLSPGLDFETRAASLQARLRVVRQLTAAGVPVGVMMAPVIPALNDHEIERLLAAVATAGAQRASFILLRLPLEVAGLFEEWLRQHYPDRAARVLNHLRGMRSGRLNDPRFGHRCRGEGAYAALLSARFAAACRRHGLDTGPVPCLDTTLFRRDPGAPEQRGLFDAI